MRTTPHTAATLRSGLFATPLQFLILTLILLSIGCLFARIQVRNTANTTSGHLRSAWFNSLPRSEDTIASAGPRSAGRPDADQPALTAHARSMHCRQALAGS